MPTRLSFDLAWYCDNRPEGWYVVLRPAALVGKDAKLLTSDGDFPLDNGDDPLYLRITPSGQKFIAAQSQQGKGILLWTPTPDDSGNHWSIYSTYAYGINTVLWQDDSHLIIGAPDFGATGLRFWDPTKQLLATGDQTASSATALAAQLGVTGLWEWTQLGNLTIGQGVNACIAIYKGIRYVIESGGCYWIRFTREGDKCAVAIVKSQENRAVLHWFREQDVATGFFPVEEVFPSPPSTPVPSFHFTHPLTIAPFKDPLGSSGAPCEVVVNQTGQGVPRPFFVAEDSLAGTFKSPELLGIYTEAASPQHAFSLARSLQTRLVVAHDGPSDWRIPSGLLPWDIPLIELYLVQGEAIGAAHSRWLTQMRSLLSQWPGDVGCIPMYYTQNGVWTEDQVLQGLEGIEAVINLSPRIKLCAPFEFQRADGIISSARLRQAFDNMVAAATPAILIPVITSPKPIVIQGDFFMLDPKTMLIYMSLRPSASRAGCFNLLKPNGNVYSIQANGDVEERGPGADGAFEVAQITGSVAVFNSFGNLHAFGIAAADKVL